MPMINEDFTGISSSFQQLENGTYRFKVLEINDQSEDPDWKAKNVGSDKTPALVFVSEVQDGERKGSPYYDYIYTKQKDGKVNKVGLGRIKAYAEAIIGKESANNPNGINTDDLLNGSFDGVIEKNSWTDKVTKEQKSRAELVKILPAS